MRLAYVTKVILLIVIGTGTLAVAYYYAEYEKEKRAPISPAPSQVFLPTPSIAIITTPSPTPTTSPEIDTSDWKTFQSSRMGFFLKYPADWTTSGENLLSTGTEVEFDKDNYAQFFIRYGLHYSQESNRPFTLNEWIDRNREIEKYASNFKEEKIILDGVPATKLSYKDKTNSVVNEIYIGKGEEIYEITSLVNLLKNDLYAPILNEIFSTFKFTKSETATSIDDWVMTSNTNIEMLVSNSIGQQEGYVLTSNSYIDTLPNANYGLQKGLIDDMTGKRNPDEVYFELQKPQNGTYSLQVIGKQQGNYHIDVSFQSGDKNTVSSIEGTLAVNQIDTYTIILPSKSIQKVNK